MKTIGIIPARMGSSRFPGKPLANILGMPMVAHCYYRSKMCKALDEVFVATCDQEISDYVSSIDGKCIMTAKSHERASDRAAEALLQIEKINKEKMDIVVMIQGDEPMLTPAMLNLALQEMKAESTIQILNLMGRIKNKEVHVDPNVVKVVVDLNGDALYFSREPIPSVKEGTHSSKMLKQICIIPFRRDFLVQFNTMSPSPLEEIESIDMNRVLEHGFKVRMVYTPEQSYAVDTQKDLERVEQIMKKDPMLHIYCRDYITNG